MDKLLQFGTIAGQRKIFDGDNSLSPAGESRLNFRSQSVQTVDIPGGTGVYIADGPGATRTVSRTITGVWRLRGDGTASDIATKKREFDAMLYRGQQRLFKEMGDGIQVWTWAFCEDVQIGESRDRMDYIWPTVRVTWYCPPGRWFGKDTTTFFDGESTFADNLPVTPLKVDSVSVADGDTVTITNNGTDYAGLYIRLVAPTGVTVTNPSFERREAGLAVDRITYQDTLNPGDVITLDSRNKGGTENTIAYPTYTKVDELHGGWIQIPPGTHTIYVSGTFSGGDATLTLDCWDVYR